MSAATSLPPGAKKEGGEAPAAAPATKVADAQGGGAAAARRERPDHQDRGQGRRRHHQRQGPDHHQRLGHLRLPAQLVTVGGNVVLTQGENVLKGDRLVIDLKTGESRFENSGNDAAGGRIRALFMPKEAAKKAKSDDAESQAWRSRRGRVAEQRHARQRPAHATRRRRSASSDDVPWPHSPKGRALI